MIVVEVEEAVIANLAHLQLYPRHRNSHHQRQTFLTILALMETFETGYHFIDFGKEFSS